MKNIVMIGPQGSGKGTQSDVLCRVLGVPHIAMGTLFRTEVAKKSALGQLISSYTDRGEIVPIDVASKVLTERLSAADAANGMILDGYPRTRDQANVLRGVVHDLGRELTDVLYLNITDEEAMRRLSGRRVCSNTACERNYHVEYHPPAVADMCDVCGAPLMHRKDDVPDAIKRRLEIFHTETMPLVALYRDEGVLREIDSMHTIEEVQAAIREALGV